MTFDMLVEFVFNADSVMSVEPGISVSAFRSTSSPRAVSSTDSL